LATTSGTDGAIFQVPGNWIEVPNNSGLSPPNFICPARAVTVGSRCPRVGSVEEHARWHDQFIPAPNDPDPKIRP
jgi:hypothetical protein